MHSHLQTAQVEVGSCTWEHTPLLLRHTLTTPSYSHKVYIYAASLVPWAIFKINKHIATMEPVSPGSTSFTSYASFQARETMPKASPIGSYTISSQHVLSCKVANSRTGVYMSRVWYATCKVKTHLIYIFWDKITQSTHDRDRSCNIKLTWTRDSFTTTLSQIALHSGCLVTPPMTCTKGHASTECALRAYGTTTETWLVNCLHPFLRQIQISKQLGAFSHNTRAVTIARRCSGGRQIGG